MENHHKKWEPSRLQTAKNEPSYQLGSIWPPPGGLSLIRYPVSYRVKEGQKAFVFLCRTRTYLFIGEMEQMWREL